MCVNDKAGRDYWDHLWESGGMPRPIYPEKKQVAAFWDNYVNWRTHRYFSQILSRDSARSKKILEIGCARSAWLPYFATEFNMSVSGLDYSEVGCRLARQFLELAGVDGEIIQADFFNPPESCLGAYDYVASFGVLEHFKETCFALSAMAKFLKPGGIIITNIPNLKGLPGLLQKWIDRNIYDIHVPLSKRDILKAHQQIGLKIIDCRHFLFLNLGVLVYEKYNTRPYFPILNKAVVRLTKLCWVLEDKLPWLLRANGVTSPYIYCVAQKLAE